MKSEIFKKAISKNQNIRILYKFYQVEFEPFFLSMNKFGKKVILGRDNISNEIKEFEFNRIYNIKVLPKTKLLSIFPILKFLNWFINYSITIIRIKHSELLKKCGYANIHIQFFFIFTPKM